MKFSTVLILISTSLTLAIVAALLPSIEKDSSDLNSFEVAYSYPETQVDNFAFSLPEFFSVDRVNLNLEEGGKKITTTTVSKVQRASTPKSSFSVKQNIQAASSSENKFGMTTVSAVFDPIAELENILRSGKKSGEVDIGGLKINLSTPIALEIPGKNNSINIQFVNPIDLLNPSETVASLIAQSPKVSQPGKVPFEEKPVSLQIYDILQPGTDQYLGMREFLLNKCNSGQCSDEELKAAGFLLMNEGEYAAANAMYARLGSSQLSSSILGANDGNIEFRISGRVLDNRGWPVYKATVKTLDGSAEDTTDGYGNYSLAIKNLFDLAKIRVNASKRGYSTATIPIDLITSEGIALREYSGLNFILESPAKSVTLKTARNGGTMSGEIVSGGGAWVEDDHFVVTTNYSKYIIPFDALMHDDGAQFRGEVEMFLFEFDKDSNIGQLLANDVFDSVAGYAGNIMKTFGMPFVLFVDNSGESIHVFKSNPMVLESQIIEMNALRTNEDQIYEPLTDADLEFLKAKSDESGDYPLDRQFLIDNDLVRFPCFWVYDQLKGIWENIGVKLVSTSGKVETIFYTINDVD